jgi:hypothetical protein
VSTAVTINHRDKRALMLLAPLLLLLVWRITSSNSSETAIATAAESVPQAERRLNKLRQTVATVPGKEMLFKKVSQELAAREKGVIAVGTAQEAQARIQQILRKLGTAEGIEVRGAEFGPVKPLGSDYGEAPVSVSFDCKIEQLVNLLATIGAQPEMLGTSEIRVSSNNPKDKRIGVRLTVSGVVPKKLIPEKKGITSF